MVKASTDMIKADSSVALKLLEPNMTDYCGRRREVSDYLPQSIHKDLHRNTCSRRLDCPSYIQIPAKQGGEEAFARHGSVSNMGMLLGLACTMSSVSPLALHGDHLQPVVPGVLRDKSGR